MNNLYPYLLKASLLQFALYLVFYFLIRNERLFTINRIFLLVSISISLLFPLINFSIPSLVQEVSYVKESRLMNIALPEIVINSARGFNIIFIDFFYCSGIIIFSILLVARLVKLFNIIRASKKEMYPGYLLVKTEGKYPTFSFLNYIFWDETKSLDPKEYELVLSHELKHIRQKHSIDIIFLEILQIFFWFNPVFIFYKKSIKEVHEFIADDSVVDTNSKKTYIGLLVKETLHNTGLYFPSAFNEILITRRIIMINQTKISRGSFSKYLCSLSLIVILFFIVSCKNTEDEKVLKPDESNSNAINETNSEVAAEIVFTVVEKMPEFTGGQIQLGKYIGENLKYPKVAAEKEVEGLVFVSFIVNEDGSVSEVKTLKGVSPECDNEALRVIKSSSGKWIAGKQNGKTVKVRYTLPIRFKLS